VQLDDRQPPPSLRSAAVGSRSVAADELLTLLVDRRGGGVRGRSQSLTWVDVRTRALEMLHGLRAAGIAAGEAITFAGRLRPERFCAELGAIAGGYVVQDAPARVVVVDDTWAADAVAGAAFVVVIDGAPTGPAIALERFAARGIAWAASHTALPQPVQVTGVDGVRPGDHVLIRAGAANELARRAFAGAAMAGAEVYVGEADVDPLLELDRAGAEIVAATAADVDRLVAAASGHRPTAARALRRLGRGPLGSRLRLVLVEAMPPDDALAVLARIGVDVATAV
jgi:hypothetical protein